MTFPINKLTTIIGGACSVLPVLAQNGTSERPNILFILSDDHARTAISAYGGINAELAPTPQIDRLAESGALFRNMLCTNAISGPSRACLITGKYSTANGFYQNEGGIVFDNSQQTSQKILQANGYTTALVGKWHLFSEPTGFDYYKIHDNPGQQGTYWDPVFNTNGKKAVEKGYATNITTDAALEWLENGRDKTKPFCLMLHYKAPHRPWEPDSVYLDLFKDVEFPYPDTFDDDYSTREKTAGASWATIEYDFSRGDLKQIPPDSLTPKEKNQWLWFGGMGEKQAWSPAADLKGEALKKWKFQTYIKDYLRCIRSVDDNVGRVLDYLEANGLDKNTIVIYMGDQGFFLGEHGWYDKRWMYEESLQMPCLIRFPERIKPRTEIDNLALNIDIAPTLLDYAGIRIPSDIQGVSLRPLLEQDESKIGNWRQSAYYQYFEYPRWHHVQPHYGVRTQRYKLIHFYYDIDVWEFYDLEKDPHELTNRIADPAYASIIKELKAEIARLQKQYGDDITLEERRELTRKYAKSYQEFKDNLEE